MKCSVCMFSEQTLSRRKDGQIQLFVETNLGTLNSQINLFFFLFPEKNDSSMVTLALRDTGQEGGV